MRGGERISKVFLDSRYCLADGSIEIPGGGLLLDPTDRRGSERRERTLHGLWKGNVLRRRRGGRRRGDAHPAGID